MRQTNESTVYRTGRNSIALSFQTSVSSGTLLQLGDPEGSLEYAVLEVRKLQVNKEVLLGLMALPTDVSSSPTSECSLSISTL